MTDRRAELARWYTSRAYSEIRNAKRYARLFHVDALIHACEAIEFSSKAICTFLDVEYDHKRHFLDSKAVVQLAERMTDEGFGDEVSNKVLRTIPIILGYTNDIREVMRYGVDKDGALAPPQKLFERNYFTAVIEHANLFCDLLHRVEITKRTSVGVLNGYVTGSSDENPCRPGFSSEGSAYWVKRLREHLLDLDVTEIDACQISSEFALIVNPFGEHYPEIDVERRLVFQQLKDYVEDGGTYVNCAGFPFFYAWDVSIPDDRKAPVPICEDKIAIPVKSDSEFVREGKLPMFQLLLQWTGTLLYKEFKVMPTGGSPTKVEIYQTEKDMENFGDLSRKLESIVEFRALTEKAENAIPLVRAGREGFGEVYPICALPCDRGYLLLAGMSTSKASDYDLVVNAVDAFYKWYKKRVSTFT